MISANNITLRVGKKALFEEVNIKFTEGNCYGMIGANGAGKSTFLKILSGQLEPTSGDVVISQGQRLSFLQQDHFKYDEYQVLDTVIMGNARLYEIMKEKDAIYMKEDFSDEDGIRAAELEGEFIFGMISNSTSVGGFKKLTGPDVMLDDGVFEVMFIRMPRNLLDLNEIIASLVSGNDTKMIEAFKTSALTVICEEEVPWTLDGEYGGEHMKVEIKNLKHSVEIMLPVNEEVPLINNATEISETE